MKPTFKDHLSTTLLKILPQHALAEIMYQVTRLRWKPVKNLLINLVIRRYGVNIAEAEITDPGKFESFNAFFTRSLRDGARPIDGDPDSIVCPADGKLSQRGNIHQGKLIQAKGHDFALLDLLAGNEMLEQEFSGGSYATIYLSPRDYHRVHMPVAATLREMHFVPGKLFSVSEATTQLVPGLFARNERVISIFDSPRGPVAVILVGAIFVGSMETVWSGEIRSADHTPGSWQYQEQSAVTLKKGDEMGRFNMGSTVILLFPSGYCQWNDDFKPGKAVNMGESIGSATPVVAETA